MRLQMSTRNRYAAKPVALKLSHLVETNLYRHLKNHHRHLHEECMAKKSGEKSGEKDSQAHCSKQTTITASFASVTVYVYVFSRHFYPKRLTGRHEG